jgi:hypothetical protein
MQKLYAHLWTQPGVSFAMYNYHKHAEVICTSVDTQAGVSFAMYNYHKHAEVICISHLWTHNQE